jgi:arylsulfatase A-like enzyme
MKTKMCLVRNSGFILIFCITIIQVCAQGITSSQRPNILWIVSEDNSASYLGCYGNKMATTPNLDKLASEGILYENAYAAAPVCAPTRSTLITGIYATSMGTQNMRSNYPIPAFIHFYPYYLRKAGYYCTNRDKKDYNTVDQPDVWNESSKEASYKNRKPGQPFFAVINIGTTHEGQIFRSIPENELKHDPNKMPIPAYLPPTTEVKHDLAQYYDKIEEMDAQVREILKQLQEDGLAENTIVFYYSDHGGVLPRSKRFVFENGLHIPLIIRIPKKYQYLAPGKPGTRTDRLVNEVDFAPTLLSIAGIKIPGYMQGKAFLGAEQSPASQYVYGFRQRMDESYDMCRTVRDQRYRYIRNYMPNRIGGQHIRYLWLAPSMRSWEAAYKKGECNKAQSAFWEPKPPEELYDVKEDPDNVHNLAEDPKYQAVLERMRKANNTWIRQIHDAGFMPEAMMVSLAERAHTTIYQYVRSKAYPQEEIFSIAITASMEDPKNINKLMDGLRNPNPVIRYWSAYGCAMLKKDAMPAEQMLVSLLDDPFPDVAIAASEALYYLGEKDKSLNRLMKALDDNDCNGKVRLHALNVLRLFDKDDWSPVLGKLKYMALHPVPVKGENYSLHIIHNLLFESGDMQYRNK